MEQACGSFHALFLLLQPGSLAWPWSTSHKKELRVSSCFWQWSPVALCHSSVTKRGSGWWHMRFMDGWMMDLAFSFVHWLMISNPSATCATTQNDPFPASEVCLFCRYFLISFFIPPEKGAATLNHATIWKCVLVLPDYGTIEAGWYLLKHQMLAIIVKKSPGSSPRADDESVRFLCPDFELLLSAQ